MHSERVQAESFRFNWVYTIIVLCFASALGLVTPILFTIQVMPDARAGRPWSEWSGGFSPPHLAFFWLLGVAFVAYFVRIAYRNFRTAVTADALIQHDVFSTKSIPWSEIRSIEHVQYAVHVHGEGVKIIVTPFAFRDPFGVVGRIYELARANGARIL